MQIFTIFTITFTFLYFFGSLLLTIYHFKIIKNNNDRLKNIESTLDDLIDIQELKEFLK